MEGKLFLKAVRHLLDPIDKNIPRQLFFIESATFSGDIVKGNAVCTSSNFKNNTFNFRFPESGEVRTLHSCHLLSVNNREVML